MATESRLSWRVIALSTDDSDSAGATAVVAAPATSIESLAEESAKGVQGL